MVVFHRELWGVILRDWEENCKKKAKLIRQLVYQGIPEHMRGMAWQCLSGGQNRELRDKYPKLITVCLIICLHVSIGFYAHTHILNL